MLAKLPKLLRCPSRLPMDGGGVSGEYDSALPGERERECVEVKLRPRPSLREETEVSENVEGRLERIDDDMRAGEVGALDEFVRNRRPAMGSCAGGLASAASFSSSSSASVMRPRPGDRGEMGVGEPDATSVSTVSDESSSSSLLLVNPSSTGGEAA